MGSQTPDTAYCGIHYSLTPDDRRTVAQRLKRTGGATVSQIRQIAAQYKVAAKVIHQQMTILKIPVLPSTSSPKPASVKSRQIELADALFKIPSSAPEPVEPPAPAPSSMADVDKAMEEVLALEKQIRADHDETLTYLAKVEKEMSAAKAEAQSHKERAEQAIQQTKKLRIATRADRDRLDEVEGQLNSQTRIYNQIKGRARWLYGELAESTTREKLLLEALAQSEADLASCRSR